MADGLLEAVTIFAAAARDAGIDLVVNNSQFQGRPNDPTFRDLQHAPSLRNLQHRLADRILDWAQVGAVHLQAPPYYEKRAQSCQPERRRAERCLPAVGRGYDRHSTRRRGRCVPCSCSPVG